MNKSTLGKIGKYCRYGVGAIGLDLSYGMFYTYLSYYLSSVLHIPEAFLLILTPIARIWDGINDPMMGTIVDNTRTKFGKYRPWILIGALSNAIVLSLLFTSFGMSGIPLYIYIAVMYILWGMTNTMAEIPFVVNGSVVYKRRKREKSCRYRCTHIFRCGSGHNFNFNPHYLSASFK